MVTELAIFPLQLAFLWGSKLHFPFCPERPLTPSGETVVDCTHVPDPREAPRPLLPYRHEVITRWELQDLDRG